MVWWGVCLWWVRKSKRGIRQRPDGSPRKPFGRLIKWMWGYVCVVRDNRMCVYMKERRKALWGWAPQIRHLLRQDAVLHSSIPLTKYTGDCEYLHTYTYFSTSQLSLSVYCDTARYCSSSSSFFAKCILHLFMLVCSFFLCLTRYALMMLVVLRWNATKMPVVVFFWRFCFNRVHFCLLVADKLCFAEMLRILFGHHDWWSKRDAFVFYWW